jgi:hypothetical protein
VRNTVLCGQPCPCRTRQGYRALCPIWSTLPAATRSKPSWLPGGC